MVIDPTRSSSYLAYLPATFSEDPLLGQFLLAFERILTGLEGSKDDLPMGLEQIIAAIPNFFDPLKMPLELLQWLAGWVALSLRADWSEEQQRQFLAKVLSRYPRRGTKQNLLDLLNIYTAMDFQIGVHSTIGVDTQINETSYSPVEIEENVNTIFQIGVHSTIGVDTQINGWGPHYFRVTVTMPNFDLVTFRRQNQIIQALIDLEKPAHTVYDYCPQHTTMQIGVTSHVGVDTLLGNFP